MRIIATVTNDLTTDQRMIRTCTSLSNHGHEVLLVGRRLPGSVPLKERPYGQKRWRLFFNKGKLFYLEHNLRLFFFLLFQKMDIVHAVDLDTLLPGFLVTRLRRKNCVYDAHEYFTEVPEVVERPGVKKAWEALARFCIPRLTFAITVCDSLAMVFQEKYGLRFEVVRNLPFQGPAPQQKSLPTKRPFILLYQGVLNEGRGLEETVEAMPQLPGVELWLAGEGDLSGYLRGLVAEKSLQGRVKFLGRLSPEQLAELTPQADLGLNLLKNKGLNYYYSLANKAFDYIQAGLPSLAMQFPEYQKLNEQFQVFELLDALHPALIVEKTTALMSNAERYNQLAENCQKAAKALTWEKEEKVLLDFYQKIK